MVSSDSPASVDWEERLELVLFEADLDGAGALVGELRDALDGTHQVFRADDDELVVVAREDGLVVGELAGELAAGEDAAADAEEEGLVVVGEVEGLDSLSKILGASAELSSELSSASALRGMRVFFSPEMPSRASPSFSTWARRWPSVATMAMDSDLEHQQGAVEGVAGLLVRDGEDGLRDHVLERGGGDAEGAGGGELGDGGEVGAGHADHLGVGAAGADLDPVVVHELDGDVALGEELDVVVQLAGGDGAGAGLFDLGGAGGADGLVEVGGGDGEGAGCAVDAWVASKRKFERMGMVVLRSTTDWAAVSSRRSSARETVISRLPVGAGWGVMACS